MKVCEAREQAALLVFGLALSCCISSAQQTAAAPTALSAVAIENTNAAFVTTDVDIPQANPARPTVTNPAHLPPTGYLQIEQGFLDAGRSPGALQTQISLAQTSKVALTTRVLVELISEPYAFSRVSNADGTSSGSNDPGDLILGGQVVLHKSVGPLPTISVGYLERVWSGTSANLDSGSFARSVVVLLGGDVRGGLHYDLNLLSNEQTNDPVRRLQSGQTLSVTHELFSVATQHNLSGTIEIAHFTQPFTLAADNGGRAGRFHALDLLFAPTYSIRPNLVVDASLTLGLTGTSTRVQGGFGITYLYPRRLWRDRHPVVIAVRR